jgi:hypothetical protein
MDGKLQGGHWDEAIARLAERQYGVVARRQLLRLGLTGDAIDNRIRRGRLRRIHRGVYAVGHRVLGQEGHWMAAVLLAGPGAVLSHRSAAALWGIRPTSHSRLEVTVARERRPSAAIQLHYGRLPSDEITTHRGIPVTTVPHTLLDLASAVSPALVERAVNEAEVRRLSDPLSLADLLERHPRRRGAAALRSLVMAGRIGEARTRSDFEAAFLAFLDRFGLPRPEVNAALVVPGRTIEPDFLWRAQQVIVELDGYETHGTRAAFESDRARDRALALTEWRRLRVTWRQLEHEPAALAADLRVLLTARSRTLPSPRTPA